MTKINKAGIIIFASILVLLGGISLWGILVDKENEIMLQGQIECTEITVSGTLPGRVAQYYVEEGEHERNRIYPYLQ